jgi:myo-inositol-1-phosphate synthase
MSRKTGVLIVGLNGSVGNTVVSGAKSATYHEFPLYGMLTEAHPMAGIKFTDWREFIFGGWDLNSLSAYDIAASNGIIPNHMLKGLEKPLSLVKPFQGIVCEPDYYFGKDTQWIKINNSLEELISQTENDIHQFKEHFNLDSCCVVNLSSPPKVTIQNPSNVNKEKLFEMIKSNSPLISSSLLYAIAAINTGCGYIDFTSSQTLDIKGILDISNEKKVPLAGRDGATGETILKIALAEFLLKRNLHLSGWFSTNLLGNNDGLVLQDYRHAELKVEDKTNVLSDVLGYSDFENIVNINYYRPRGDQKEAWNSIDFQGWLGLEMSLKLDWLGRDSILAAPLVLDLARHIEYAKSAGDYGILDHLQFYFKHPVGGHTTSFSESYGILLNYYNKKNSM